MSLIEYITKPIFSSPKPRSCPNCGKRLIDFLVDYETFSIECINCHHKFDPKKVFYHTDILLISKYLPSDVHDQFLENHGFVKETPIRTPKLMVIVLILILFLFGILFVMSLTHFWWKSFGYPLAIITLIFFIFFFYQREKKSKWKRIK